MEQPQGFFRLALLASSGFESVNDFYDALAVPAGPAGRSAPVSALAGAVLAHSPNVAYTQDLLQQALSYAELQRALARNGYRPVIADEQVHLAWQQDAGQRTLAAFELSFADATSARACRSVRWRP